MFVIKKILLYVHLLDGNCRCGVAIGKVSLREGLKKKQVFFPHFVHMGFPPPPLMHIGGFYNNIIK